GRRGRSRWAAVRDASPTSGEANTGAAVVLAPDLLVGLDREVEHHALLTRARRGECGARSAPARLRHQRRGDLVGARIEAEENPGALAVEADDGLAPCGRQLNMRARQILRSP